MIFYITNFPQFLKNHKVPFVTNLYEKEENRYGKVFFYIDGYFIPRMDFFDIYKNVNQYDLLNILYKKYGEKFISYIKGVFNIIIIDKSKFYIYNDIHSIKRVFTYTDGANFFISNELKEIRKHFSLSPDYENAAIFCLLNHFFHWHTLFEKITCSIPASKIAYSDRHLKTSVYWKPNELFLGEKESDKKESDFSIFWEKLVNSYVIYIKPKQISITLTGGNDSRLVLAPLLNKNYTLHAFSFGNPQSADGVVAKQIAHASKITYSNYFVKNASKEWLSDQAEKLNEIGNTLINLHRAHRNDALAKEIMSYPATDMIFTGLMGGEYLKEPSYDNIILPDLFYSLVKNRNKRKSILILKEQLIHLGIKVDLIDLTKVYGKIMLFLNDNYSSDTKKRKFILTYSFYGCAHHSQDSAIFNYHGNHVVNPFMDIDFLERLNTSVSFYVSKKRKPFNRLFHSILYVKTTNDLAPELSNIPYAKKGQYTANDMLHKPIINLFKRLKYLIMRDKQKFPSNFPMGNWLYCFSKEQLDSLHPDIKKIFKKDFLMDKLDTIKMETTEEKWHVVTNPINLSLYLKRDEKN